MYHMIILSISILCPSDSGDRPYIYTDDKIRCLAVCDGGRTSHECFRDGKSLTECYMDNGESTLCNAHWVNLETN